MPRAFRLSLALAVLFGLTLGPKFLTTARLARGDDARLTRDIATLLRADGFRVEIVPHRLFHLVRARKSECILIAANAATNGYYRDRFAGATARIGPTLYHYGSGRGGAFPRFIPVAAEFAQNWSYRFGVVVPRTPVIAVAASPACQLDSVSWSALRIWPVATRTAGVR